MRIRRFEAPDTTTALSMVKKEMGEDAVILSTKPLPNYRPGRMGRNGGPWLEVVAAMDYDVEAHTGRKIFSSDNRGRPLYDSDFKVVDGPAANQRDALANRKETFTDTPSSSSLTNRLSDDMRHEAFELSKRFGHLKDLEQSDDSVNNRSKSQKPDPTKVAIWRNQLIDQISVKSMIADHDGNGPVVIALVGATGVGKTTTAAKLAAWFTLREKKSVALLSMDCYRIGATDQLRTYARIMKISCEIALRKNDLKNAIKKHSDKDIIIIDTAGKNPYDTKHVKELQDWFGSLEVPVRSQLVLSATSKKEDLATIIDAYRPLSVHGLILSKLDETRAYANLCRQVVHAALPLTCLCTGQRVPEDFMLASKSFIGKLFKEGWLAVEPELNAIAANM